MKTKEQLLENFQRRHGHAYGQSPTAAVTPEQRRAVAEAIAARDKTAAAGAAPAYTEPDYLELIEKKKKEKGCGYCAAAEAVLRTEAGRRARENFIRAKNPHIR